MTQDLQEPSETRASPRHLELPAPTSHPLYFALGIALLFAGLVTDPIVSGVGAALSVFGVIGWWRDVLPQEKEVEVEVTEPPPSDAMVESSRGLLQAGSERHRARLPVEIRPYSSGFSAGAAGAVAMAIVACTYGLVGEGSIWFPINLQAAILMPSFDADSIEQLKTFSLMGLVVATFVHALTSVLVGLVYAAILPMFPGRPLIWGGLIAPLLWSGVIWALIPLVNPALSEHIRWGWFIASQIAFGLTAGMVITRVEAISTLQWVPLSDRAGLEIAESPSSSNDDQGDNR